MREPRPPKERKERRLAAATLFGRVTLVSVAPLLVWDLAPRLFPARAHDGLAGTPLVLVALACVVYPIVRGAGRLDLAKALVLATGFLLWAANQLWPDAPNATLCNDVAIAAFVLDAVLIMAGFSPEPGRQRVSSDTDVA